MSRKNGNNFDSSDENDSEMEETDLADSAQFSQNVVGPSQCSDMSQNKKKGRPKGRKNLKLLQPDEVAVIFDYLSNHYHDLIGKKNPVTTEVKGHPFGMSLWQQ